MIIGIDFDNTIASYDEPMHRTAAAQGLIPQALPKNKKLVRDAIRALEDGESRWRALQVHSYGPGMPEARAMDGVKDFIGASKERGIPVRIVSHKTEFANFGAPGVNLRESALRWLEAQGFVDSARHGVGREHIHFEGTREEKIARIRALGITHFVDDLEETFLEQSFLATKHQQAEDTGCRDCHGYERGQPCRHHWLSHTVQHVPARIGSHVAHLHVRGQIERPPGRERQPRLPFVRTAAGIEAVRDHRTLGITRTAPQPHDFGTRHDARFGECALLSSLTVRHDGHRAAHANSGQEQNDGHRHHDRARARESNVARCRSIEPTG